MLFIIYYHAAKRAIFVNTIGTESWNNHRSMQQKHWETLTRHLSEQSHDLSLPTITTLISLERYMLYLVNRLEQITALFTWKDVEATKRFQAYLILVVILSQSSKPILLPFLWLSIGFYSTLIVQIFLWWLVRSWECLFYLISRQQHYYRLHHCLHPQASMDPNSQNDLK
jgi:hypothetical protein